MKSPSESTTFNCNSGLARYSCIDISNDAQKTTRYVGNVEFISSGGITQTKRYLVCGAIITTYSNQTTIEERYALSDHLGSTDVIIDGNGNLIESSSFDAWGNRRSTANRTDPGSALTTTTHGFTGHEHLDGIGLIHMNGRIYDPRIGRFIQSDTMVDADIQGLNRYSYVLNNPLSATDPSGHLTHDQWAQMAFTLAVTIISGGAAAGTWQGLALSTGGKLLALGSGGAIAGAANGGLQGAAWGAVSAQAFYGIGSYFEGAAWAHSGASVFGTNLNLGGYTAKVLAHGVTGGALQHLQGGRFGSGFAAAGVTEAFSGAIDSIDPANPGFSPQRVVAAAMLGGSVSSLTGGKFGHGAVTSAFARAFNDEQGHGSSQSEVLTEQPADLGVPTSTYYDGYDVVIEYDGGYYERRSGGSLNDAISIWAPPSENDTSSYQASVAQALGVEGTTLMRDLTFEQRSAFVTAIRNYEGWREGSVSFGRISK